jgi:FtsH-binding integral membrane protein
LVELQMVKRMIVRGLYLAPVLILALLLWNGPDYAVSGLVGLGLTLLNLYLAAAIIGRIAESAPRLLMVAAVFAFTVGLALVTGISFVLKTTGLIDFPVTGFTLIVSHLLLVGWEAVGSSTKPNNAPVRAGQT